MSLIEEFVRVNDDGLVSLKLIKKQIVRLGGIQTLEGHLRNVEIQALDLTNSFLDDREIEIVSNLLIGGSSVSCRNLQVLELDGNSFGPVGFENLAKALINNSSIKIVSLNGNNLKDQGAVYLSDVMKVNSRIEEVYLEQVKFTKEEIRSISSALELNRTIRVLQLSFNFVGAEGSRFLGDALKFNSSIEKLFLNSCRIGNTGVYYLAKGLETNSSVYELHLSENHIGNSGANHIRDALKLNRSLARINLIDTLINDQGALSIIDGLKDNDCITDIALDSMKGEFLYQYYTRKEEEKESEKTGISSSTRALLVESIEKCQLGRSLYYKFLICGFLRRNRAHMLFSTNLNLALIRKLYHFICTHSSFRTE